MCRSVAFEIYCIITSLKSLADLNIVDHLTGYLGNGGNLAGGTQLKGVDPWWHAFVLYISPLTY